MRRIDPANWTGRSPMIGPTAIHSELADRVQAASAGGLGVIQELAQQLDPARAINRTCPIFKLRLPYSEADHLLNIATTSWRAGGAWSIWNCGGTTKRI